MKQLITWHLQSGRRERWLLVLISLFPLLCNLRPQPLIQYPIYLRWIVLPQITLARKALTGTPGTVFYSDPYFRQSSWQHWFTTTVKDPRKMCLHTQKQYSLYSYDTVLQTPDVIPELAISNLTKKGTCLWVIASRQMCLQTCSVVTWFSQITRVCGAEQRLFVWCRQAFMQPRYQK